MIRFPRSGSIELIGIPVSYQLQNILIDDKHRAGSLRVAWAGPIFTPPPPQVLPSTILLQLWQNYSSPQNSRGVADSGQPEGRGAGSFSQARRPGHMTIATAFSFETSAFREFSLLEGGCNGVDNIAN